MLDWYIWGPWLGHSCIAVDSIPTRSEGKERKREKERRGFNAALGRGEVRDVASNIPTENEAERTRTRKSLTRLTDQTYITTSER